LKRNDIRHIDSLLLVSVLFLVILGAAVVYSASSYRAEQIMGDGAYFFKNQMIRVLIGSVFLLLLALVNYRFWIRLSRYMLPLAFAMLLLLFTDLPFVLTIKGATRWLRFGPIQFQPSDFARYTLILFLAWSLNRKRDQLQDSAQSFLRHLAIISAFALAIAFEKDLSTAMILAIIAFTMFYFAEIKLSYLMISGLCFTAAAQAFILTHSVQFERVRKFFDLWVQDSGSNWQLDQSMISLALGGFFGQGLGNSRGKYDFLPEAHKDFIFSIIGEEMGFLGATLVLLLFFLIIYRGIKISLTAPDGEGRLLASGITACIGIYALINSAVALGMLPTTGIPMPFISYGGSALVTHLAAVGLLINISAQSRESYSHYHHWRTYQKRLERTPFRSSHRRKKRMVFG